MSIKILFALLTLVLLTNCFNERFSFSKKDVGQMISKPSQYFETDTNTYLYWSGTRKLSKLDFRNESSEQSQMDAISVCGIDFQVEGKGDTLFVFFSARFNRTKSWLTKRESFELLQHEQLHFDIAELAARHIRKKCSLITVKSLDQAIKAMQPIYDEIYDLYVNQLNDEYDLKTKHGQYLKKQAVWNKKIARELKALNAYSNPTVVLHLRP